MKNKDNRRAIVRFNAFLVGIILILGVSGCSQNSNYVSENSGTTSSAAAYFPVSEGKVWNYNYTQQNGTSFSQKCYWKGTTAVNGKTINKYIGEFLGLDGAVSSTMEVYYEVTDSYVKWHGSSAQTTNEGLTWLTFPIQTGKTWITMSSPEVKATVRAQETISVPAGTFYCYRIDWDTLDLPLVTSQWYAKEVGLIKTESHSYYYIGHELVSMTTTQELTSKNF